MAETFEKAWAGFAGTAWKQEIDVRDFIQKNYTPYEGDESFLAGPTEATKTLWQEVLDLFQQERDNGGVIDMDTKIVSKVDSHDAGYIHQDLEQIVGLQTDKPLKRALQPFGGIRMAETACESYGYKVDPEISYIFREYRKTHNEGVFDVIHQKCAQRATMPSSPVCRTHMAEVVLSATIAVLHCMASTV